MKNLILHIDTASGNGLVMLAEAGVPVAVRENGNATEHASFVQPAIAGLMEEYGVTPGQVQCLAVANGPGSYTGLRVGLAAAKGLCFAWNKPLLTLSSLKIMAKAMQQLPLPAGMITSGGVLYAPLVDARRMEVFRALYRFPDLATVLQPGAEILSPGFLDTYLAQGPVLFAGNGAAKWQEICTAPNAGFLELPDLKEAFAALAYEMAVQQLWADLAYSEPFYAKAFYSTQKSR